MSASNWLMGILKLGGSQDLEKAYDYTECFDIEDEDLVDFIEGMGYKIGVDELDLVGIVAEICARSFANDVENYIGDELGYTIEVYDNMEISPNYSATKCSINWLDVFSKADDKMEAGDVEYICSEMKKRFGSMMECLGIDYPKPSDFNLVDDANESKRFTKTYTQFLNESKKSR